MIAVLAALAPISASLPPQVWSCTGVDDHRVAKKFSLFTNGAGEPIDLRGPAELEELGSGLGQAVSVWTGPAKQRALLAYGSCDLVPPGALPRA